MKKLLIVCYSWSNGNTERIAKELRAATGADLIKLETLIPYPEDYQTTVDQGQEEVERGYQPKLKPLDVEVSGYDVIAVGTPTWWYTMAPAVLTFLSSQDWTGKTVISFMTNGEWPGHVIRDMERLCKGAQVRHPLEVRFDSSGGDHMETPEKPVQDWAEAVKQEL
ncbi:NAD(P)H-dependent oxidoreductase [Oscillibacter sp. MSJ-2]|uniref:NAD(P)H-dependent oxidoreductase n=1 Tax=Dysosmobacter acutus TaxID=2841504 RepID=A0ABS6FBD9_9FIRM|nr:flavodoxin [Dysosmobacter acutus]MBU5627591.1 NAD(P)H-dependent oxidoreductase [Dysosmobacter acutus]